MGGPVRHRPWLGAWGVSEEVWVYLDVDGVINTVGNRRPQWGWEDEATEVQVNGFSILYSPEMVAALNDLADMPHVRMHWLTTWEYDAPNDLCPIVGLKGQVWPVLRNAPQYEPTPTAWWKHRIIREHLPAGQRALWIDDDIAFDRAAGEWLDQNPNVTPVCPRTELGITRRQMRLITDAAHLAPSEGPQSAARTEDPA